MFISRHTLKWTKTCRSSGDFPHAHTAHFLLNRHTTAIRTLIARKERQIGKLRDEVDRLKLILPEHDTGKPENRHNGMTEHWNTGTDGDRYTKNRNTKKPRPA